MPGSIRDKISQEYQTFKGFKFISKLNFFPRLLGGGTSTFELVNKYFNQIPYGISAGFIGGIALSSTVYIGEKKKSIRKKRREEQTTDIEDLEQQSKNDEPDVKRLFQAITNFMEKRLKQNLATENEAIEVESPEENEAKSEAKTNDKKTKKITTYADLSKEFNVIAKQYRKDNKRRPKADVEKEIKAKRTLFFKKVVPNQAKAKELTAKAEFDELKIELAEIDKRLVQQNSEDKETPIVKEANEIQGSLALTIIPGNAVIDQAKEPAAKKVKNPDDYLPSLFGKFFHGSVGCAINFLSGLSTFDLFFSLVLNSEASSSMSYGPALPFAVTFAAVGAVYAYGEYTEECAENVEYARNEIKRHILTERHAEFSRLIKKMVDMLIEMGMLEEEKKNESHSNSEPKQVNKDEISVTIPGEVPETTQAPLERKTSLIANLWDRVRTRRGSTIGDKKDDGQAKLTEIVTTPTDPITPTASSLTDITMPSINSTTAKVNMLMADATPAVTADNTQKTLIKRNSIVLAPLGDAEPTVPMTIARKSSTSSATPKSTTPTTPGRRDSLNLISPTGRRSLSPGQKTKRTLKKPVTTQTQTNTTPTNTRRSV